VIVLIGFMGAGKTTVGRLVAGRLGLPFVDTDEVVARRAGASVPEIFDTKGEAVFRELERVAAAEALAGPQAVVALGGGAPFHAGTRAALAGATVVHLDVSFEEATSRLGPGIEGGERPMLDLRDPKELYIERALLYDEAAGVRVLTDGLTPEKVAAEVAAVASPEPGRRPRAGVDASRIPVEVGGGAYEIVVGRTLAGGCGALIPGLDDVAKAFVITHPELAKLAEGPLASLSARGLEVDIAFVPEGEKSKSLDVAGALYGWLASSKAHRRDLVVGVGGGVVTDLAGFVASTYARGMRVAHVPTSLLAQVDAAIGGKTGVNLAEGKNLVGSLWQPAAVICDVELLASLPQSEVRSGLAEVVKYGFIADPGLLDLLEGHAPAIVAVDPALLTEIVTRSATIKAGVVAADERDAGVRAHLNYGHTFAHAIETDAVYEGVRHGEAVALGMMTAAHLAHELGMIDAAVVERHRGVLGAVGLPTSAPLEIEALEPAWQLDKKYKGGVRFVLLEGLGEPVAGVEAPRTAVVKALERMA